jgi:hypothetical protein
MRIVDYRGGRSPNAPPKLSYLIKKGRPAIQQIVLLRD